MKPTVHDIAERAGVSLATIDRVLNMRPGVHAATRARVEAAIAELGYVRDIAAANLAKGRNYSLVFILPGNDNSFMATLRAEVRAAAARAHLERTAIRVIEVPPFNASALTEALEVARREKPSGVAFVATDSEDVAEAADRLAEDGIATVTFHNPPRGYMNAAQVQELDRLVDALAADDAVRVIVFTGGVPGVFIRHYDVAEILAVADIIKKSGRNDAELMEGAKAGNAVSNLFDKVDRLPKPTIAAIVSVCPVSQRAATDPMNAIGSAAITWSDRFTEWNNV